MMDEYMCPNCVTPWKCNGPHILEHELPAGAETPQGPERIWLQDCGDSHEGPQLEDVTWCADQINDDDTEYIRADVHRALLQSVTRERDRHMEAAKALEKDAARFRYLQDLPASKAQAFFWNWSSRRERSRAIDSAMSSTGEGSVK